MLKFNKKQEQGSPINLALELIFFTGSWIISYLKKLTPILKFVMNHNAAESEKHQLMRFCYIGCTKVFYETTWLEVTIGNILKVIEHKVIILVIN